MGDFRSAVESKGCIFHQIDLIADPLPFDSETVDCVTAMHILEHLENVNHLLGEARRVLKPQGRLFVEVPSIRSLFVPLFILAGVVILILSISTTIHSLEAL